MADPTAIPPSSDEVDWHGRESFGKAFIQIAVAGLVFGGGLFAYYRHAQTKKTVYDMDKAARELVARGNPKDLLQAKAKFTDALALDSSDGFGTSSLALVECLLWGSYDMASEQAPALAAVAAADDHGGNIDEHFAADALARLAQHKPDDAYTYLKAVAERGAAGPGIFDAMGLIKREQGKLDESRVLLKKAHDQGWSSARFADDLADSYFDDGDDVNAEDFYEKGLQSNSEHLRSLVGQARCRIARAQNLLEASKSLELVMAKPEGETAPRLKAMAATGLAELRSYEQKYDEALKDADLAVQADGAYPWGYAIRGSARAATNQATASADFDQAIKLDSHVSVFYVEAAQAMAKLKDGAKAEAYLGAYAAALKTDDRYHVVYGDLMRDLGNLDKAISEYGLAIKANTLNAAAHYDLGLALLSKNDPDKAKTEIAAALEVQPTYPAAHIQLGNILFAKHDYENSLEAYAGALVDLKRTGAPREQIDALLDDVNQRLLKDKKKDTAKLWMDQGRQLVR